MGGRQNESPPGINTSGGSWESFNMSFWFVFVAFSTAIFSVTDIGMLGTDWLGVVGHAGDN